jgi:hypothetical protein
MDNHLLVGLGGTGGRIVRALRKSIFERYRADDPEGVNLRYLYVDSSDELMGDDDPTWKTLGRSVQLKKTSQLLLSGLNLQSVLDNLGSYPGISPWLGSRELFQNIIISANAANVVGGQRRRLGRFLFACRVHQYREQVQALVKEMETGGTGATTFHVCCGLAGGTGSGAVVDALAQIREMYPDRRHKVVAYLFVPDRNAGANRALANYHPNGYAALMELNALSCGIYHPWNLAAKAGPARLTVQDPFNCAYLFSDENEDHHKVDVDHELPEIVAAFLYQKMIAAKDMNWDSLRRLESYENMDYRAEESPAGAAPERSRMFFAFGVKRIAYPEEEIREYMTYAFARQSTLQLLFNRWSDSFGYVDEPVNQPFAEFVRLNETKQRWHLTDEHFCLSDGILPDEMKSKRWKPINAFWADLIPHFKTHVREAHPGSDRVWLDELMKLCEAAYGTNYRDLGVRKFYETKRADIKDHVRELRGGIESDLFADWAEGRRSLSDIGRLLAELVTSIEERLDGIDDRVSRTKEHEASAHAKVQANAREWAKVGVISGWIGKRQSLLDAQGECLHTLYVYRTRLEGWEFSRRLMQALLAELNVLAADVARAASMLADALKEIDDALHRRCADAGRADVNSHIVRFYDPEAVKDFTKALTLDHELQKTQTNTVRTALTGLLGESRSFGTFNTRVGRNAFIALVESSCQESAVAAHNNAVSSNADRTRILQVSIVERLSREYAGNSEGLRAYARHVVGHARTYLGFNDAEVRRQGPGAFQGGGAVSYLAIMLPEAPELGEFRERLRKELRDATPGAKDEVPSQHSRNEITLVSLTNLFPLRFVSDVSFLKTRYDDRVAVGGVQARMELHGEGDGTQWPDLFIGDVDQKRYLALLLIAQAMGLVRRLEDPDTGIASVYLVAKDTRGRDRDPLPLGADLASVTQDANAVVFDTLRAAVQAQLEQPFRHQSKRDELLTSVLTIVDEVKAVKKNPLDKVYKTFVQASHAAEELLAKTA